MINSPPNDDGGEGGFNWDQNNNHTTTTTTSLDSGDAGDNSNEENQYHYHQYDDSEDHSMASRRSGGGAGGRQSLNNLDKESEDYKKLRERNNQAVKKSRTKSRVKATQTQERVARLRQEHEDLVRRVDELKSQLAVYKRLFLQQAGAQGESDLQQMDLSFLHDDESMENHSQAHHQVPRHHHQR